MDAQVRRVLEEKIRDAESRRGDAERLAASLAGGSPEFARGVIAGGVYNSFRYQTRRLLGREPTSSEFEELLSMMGSLSGRGL
ncbi:MAG: hypothetical protein MPJ06_02615 [Nitrosopumilus sp.]|nr:hypothetical protein [Nitrosopumilus sp.]MDA7942891.1 hypothetical protein [Nitrosopumilus sp.]MDA7998755.1 hypothetical protein [Nitrosopumilus sp.]